MGESLTSSVAGVRRDRVGVLSDGVWLRVGQETNGESETKTVLQRTESKGRAIMIRIELMLAGLLLGSGLGQAEKAVDATFYGYVDSENGGAKLDHRAANRSCFWAE